MKGIRTQRSVATISVFGYAKQEESRKNNKLFDKLLPSRFWLKLMVFYPGAQRSLYDV